MIANSQGQVILVTFLFSEEVNRQHVCQASLVVTFLFLTKQKKLLATHAAKSNTNCISKLNVYYYFSTALIWSEVVGSGFLSNMQVLQSTILVP